MGSILGSAYLRNYQTFEQTLRITGTFLVVRDLFVVANTHTVWGSAGHFLGILQLMHSMQVVKILVSFWVSGFRVLFGNFQNPPQILRIWRNLKDNRTLFFDEHEDMKPKGQRPYRV